MAAKGLNKTASNLRFLTAGRNAMAGLAGFLQVYFGQTVCVPRKSGTATVASGTTTIAVADTSILATDVPMVTPLTKGANSVCQVIDTTVSAGVGFTITLAADPGVGGAVLNWIVFRLVSSQ